MVSNSSNLPRLQKKTNMITRRNFIQKLGLAAVAGASLNLGNNAFGQTRKTIDLFSIPRESLSDPVLSFTSAHFTPFINTDFAVRQEGSRRTEWLKLLDVKEVQRKGNLLKGVGGDSFSLLFANKRGTPLAQTQFEFSHAALGVFTLILLPVSAEPNRYEAVINHQRI